MVIALKLNQQTISANYWVNTASYNYPITTVKAGCWKTLPKRLFCNSDSSRVNDESETETILSGCVPRSAHLTSGRPWRSDRKFETGIEKHSRPAGLNPQNWSVFGVRWRCYLEALLRFYEDRHVSLPNPFFFWESWFEILLSPRKWVSQSSFRR